MNEPAAGASALRSPRWQKVVPRRAVLVAALVVLVVALAPLDLLAGRHLVVETLQFVLLGYVVPPLVVLGLPPGLRERLAGRVVGRSGQPAAREAKRHGRPVRARSWVMLILFAVVAIVWRVPVAVDAIARHPALVLGEAICLVVLGAGFWLELTDSSLAIAAVPGPKKMVMAGVAMWSMWIAAYALGFSRHVWYPAFSGHGVSAGTLIDDQEISTALLFVFPFVVFVPVLFSWLIRWLRDEEGPEVELRGLLSRRDR